MSEITNVLVADTETTGFDPETSSLLEVAAVWLPKPQDGKTIAWQAYSEFEGVIPPDAKAVHHIKESEVAPGAPFCFPRKVISDKLLSFESDTMAWAFHNSAFDLLFLPELTRPVICTYRCSLHIWPDAPSHKNVALMYWQGTEPDPILTTGLAAHRALFDAAVTASLLGRMLETHTIDQLIKLTKTPVLLTTVKFGKHKGDSWADVPRDYAQWCLYKSDMARDNMDLKYTLEVRLGLREVEAA